MSLVTPGATTVGRMEIGKGMARTWVASTLVAVCAPSWATAACQMVMPGDAGGKANPILFEGCNIEINDGSGSTATVNGLGNLTVGYDETRGSGQDQRAGSHNVVVGSRHNFSSHGGLVLGYQSETSASYATVKGDSENVASGACAAIAGGRANRASGAYGSVTVVNTAGRSVARRW